MLDRSLGESAATSTFPKRELFVLPFPSLEGQDLEVWQIQAGFMGRLLSEFYEQDITVASDPQALLIVLETEKGRWINALVGDGESDWKVDAVAEVDSSRLVNFCALQAAAAKEARARAKNETSLIREINDLQKWSFLQGVAQAASKNSP